MNKQKELSTDGGNKSDGDKLRTDLIPVEPLLALSAILTHGSEKYDDNNWKKGIKFSRVYGALLRHLWAHWLGNYKDSDSDMPHIWHAFCNLLFLVYYDYHYEEYEKYDDSQSKELGTKMATMDEFLSQLKGTNTANYAAYVADIDKQMAEMRETNRKTNMEYINSTARFYCKECKLFNKNEFGFCPGTPFNNTDDVNLPRCPSFVPKIRRK